MNIFLVALATIFTNFGTALKVSVIPFIINSVVSFVLIDATGVGINFDALAAGNPAAFLAISPMFFVVPLVLLVLWVLTFAVVAINWHRAILHNAPVGLLPEVSGLPLGRYIGRSILLGLVLFAIAMVLGLFIILAVTIFASADAVGYALVGVVGFAISSIVFALWYRMASTLPSIAINNEPTFGEGFAQTAQIKGEIFWTAVCTLLFGLVLSFLLVPFGQLPVINGIIQIATNWLSTMLGLAILTVIYRRTGFDRQG